MTKTRKEIIEEIVAFYESDPTRRAVSPGGTCQYLTSDGNMCALGRCFTEDAIKKYGDFEGGIDALIIDQELGDNWQDLLKEEYRGNTIRFWVEIQKFHDWYILWNYDNSDAKRKKYVDNLFDKWVKN